MYLLARSWGIQPSEFWAMTMSEFWVEYQYNEPKSVENAYAGNLTQGQVDELREWMESGYR